MLVEVNTVWHFNAESGYEPENYRILNAFPDIDALVVFSLIDTNQLVRPFVIPFTEFKRLKAGRLVKRINEEVSPHRLVDEASLTNKTYSLLSARWEIVKDLVNDKELLLSIATKVRQPKITSHAKALNIRNQVVYKFLNLYWRYGQVKTALVPLYHLCGATGKQRKVFNSGLGRKVVSRTGAFSARESFRVTAKDKENIIEAVKAYYLRPEGKSIKQTYLNYLRRYFGIEISDAQNINRIPNAPSLQQFRCWVKKLFDNHELIRKTKHENQYLTDFRSNESSILTDFEVPGACFEIDATVLDVHVVSRFNRNKVLGRPTLYFIVDRASGMTVGLSISLFHASWDAARLAIFNAFTDKVDYCRANGVDISESDWPCAHIPNRLIADNAEMLGLKAEAAVVPMVPLEWAPVSRPDFKPFVEGRFNTLNKDTVHSLMGATKNKDKIVKAAPDPGSRAIYTTQELTTIILRDVIDKNNEIQKSLALRSKLLVETDTKPTPLDFWRIHVERYLSALKKASSQEVLARLLRPIKVSVTKNGIYYEHMYYSNKKVRALNLSAIAKTNGRIILDARVNDECLDVLFVKLPGDSTYSLCHLLKRSKEMEGSSLTDIFFMQDWLDDQTAKNIVSQSSIETLSVKNSLERHAKSEAKKAPKNKTKKARTDNKRTNRLLEMAQSKLAVVETTSAQNSTDPTPSESASRRRYSHNVVSLPTRED